MRRYAMTMTMSAVSVAVLLLGLPLGGAWIVSALRSAGSGDRVVIIGTVILTVLVLTGTAFTAASVVASRVSRRISAPLIYLAAEAEQLGSGQVRPRLRSSGIEEIDLVQAELVRSAERVAGRIAAERQFASDASHQLRTPLTSLSLRLEEIELLAGEEEVRAEAHACLEQVERLTGVVEDLLKVSRRSGGGTTEALHLKDIFAQQREEWEPAFEQAGRTITFSDEISHPVLATPGSLAQVLATVIENSLRYGAGTTSVSVRSANGGHAVFIDAKRVLTHVPKEEFIAQTLGVELYLEAGIRGVEIGSILADRDPKTRENRYPKLELLRLAIPRRTYTDNHMDVVAAALKNVFDRRERITRGYRITKEHPIMRHFTVELAPAE